MLDILIALYLLIIFFSPLPVLGLIGNNEHRLSTRGVALLCIAYTALCLPAISCYGAGILPLCTFCAYTIPYLFAQSGYRFSVVLATTILMTCLPLPFLGGTSELENDEYSRMLGVFWLLITVPAIPGILIACVCRRRK